MSGPASGAPTASALAPRGDGGPLRQRVLLPLAVVAGAVWFVRLGCVPDPPAPPAA